jgi:hypothetical protein
LLKLKIRPFTREIVYVISSVQLVAEKDPMLVSL